MRVLLLILISSVFAFANVGKITAIKGKVFIDRDSKQITAKVGSILELKDKIVTKKKSRALVLFKDKTSITVGKSSILEVQTFVFDTVTPAKSEAGFKFGKGVFRTITGKIGKLNRKRFQIKTSTASIGIRGSVGTTVVKPNGDSKHMTHAGGFTMTDNKTGQMVVIPKGSTGALTSAGIVVAPTTAADLAEGGDVSEENKDFDEEAKEEEEKEDEEAKEEEEKEDEEAKEEEEKEDEEAKEEEEKEDEEAKEEEQKEDEEAKEEEQKEDEEAKDEEQKEEEQAKEEEKKDKEEAKEEEAKEEPKEEAKEEEQAEQEEQEAKEEPKEEAAKEEPKEQEPKEEQAAEQPQDEEQETAAVKEEAASEEQPAAQETEETAPAAEETAAPKEEQPAAEQPEAQTQEQVASDAPEQAAPEVQEQEVKVETEVADVPAQDTVVAVPAQEPVVEVQMDLPETDMDDFGDISIDMVSADIESVNVNIQIDDTPTETATATPTETPDDTPLEVAVPTETTTVAVVPDIDIDAVQDAIDQASEQADDATDTANEIVEDAVNTKPTISLAKSSFDLDKNGYDSTDLTISDAEDTASALKVTVTALNGEVIYEKIDYAGHSDYLYYTPNSNFFGVDTITITVTDSAGEVTTKQIVVTVNNVLDSSTTAEIDHPVDLTEIAKEIVGTDTYENRTILEFGYILNTSGTKISTYSVGELTPTVVIDQYISNQNTATYTGSVAALITDLSGATSSSGGSVTLNMDFGQQNLTGQINVTQGNWQASINNGAITNTGFTSTDISSAAASSVSDITGAITKGKFYGPDVQNVGGDFNLNSSTAGSVNGSFGGGKQ